MKDTEKMTAAGWTLFVLRMLVGWHFLYEGCWKLLQTDGWSCRSYLAASNSPLAPLFDWMSKQAGLVAIGDWAVMLGLVAIGLALVTGVAARLAAAFGILLMSMFYFCQMPEPFAHAFSGADGRFFVVERNLIEALALALVVVTPVWRGVVRTLLPGLAVLAVFAGLVFREYRAGAYKKVSAVTSATVKVHEFAVLSALKAPFAEKTNFVGRTVSTLALGGDLMSGRSHARDLIWTDEFMTRYHAGGTLERTARYASFCGVRAAFVEPKFILRLKTSALETGGALDCFANCATAEDAKAAKAACAAGVYLNPERADELAKAGDAKALADLVAALRSTGLPVGFGAERLGTLEFMLRQGLKPDFWVVALHALDYPSARIEPPQNSRWCDDPEKTAAFLKTRNEPWVAIRGMAGGAIAPEAAYRFARRHGATVVALDLLDYRIVETVNALGPKTDAKKTADKDKKGKK